MVSQISLGLGELAVHRLQQIPPAAQRRIEIERRATDQGIQPAAGEPGRRRAAQPVVLHQVVHDRLAIGLGAAAGVIAGERLAQVCHQRPAFGTKIHEFLHLARQSLAGGSQPERPEMGLEQFLVGQLQRRCDHGTSHHAGGIGEEVLVVR